MLSSRTAPARAGQSSPRVLSSTEHSGSSGNPAWKRGRLPHPALEPCLVELTFVQVDVARGFVLARVGWHRAQRRALEERQLHVLGKHMDPEEPALARDAV